MKKTKRTRRTQVGCCQPPIVKRPRRGLALANGRLPELPRALKYTGIASRTAPLIVTAPYNPMRSRADLLEGRSARQLRN